MYLNQLCTFTHVHFVNYQLVHIPVLFMVMAVDQYGLMISVVLEQRAACCNVHMMELV